MTINKVNRFDAMTFSNVETTPQGFLRIPAVCTRTGVFTYMLGDGSKRRELRSPEEVFKPDSFKTLAGVPLTNDHPAELVHAGNATAFTVGFTDTGDSVKVTNKTFLETIVTVVDAETIREVNSGKVELSCGYNCMLDFTPGIFQGDAYDCIQRDIVYNHLAIVDVGRAGPDVRLRLDSADAILYDESNDSEKPTRSESMAMVTLTIDGTDYQVDEAVKAAFDKMQQEIEAGNEEDITEGKKAASEEDGKAPVAPEADKPNMDAMQAKIDHLTSEIKRVSAIKTDSDFIPQYNERRKVETVAKKVGVEFKADASNMEVKKAIIKARSPEVNLDGKSVDYINGRIAGIYESLENEVSTTLGETVTASRADGAAGKDPVAEARERSRNESRVAWKKPLTATKN